MSGHVAVRDGFGQVHEPNPLGAGACLACALPFPCPTAAGGEQLTLELAPCSQCRRVHQPRERHVPCRHCTRPTADHHRVCSRCTTQEVLVT